jgi:RNA polymerase sigma-70 factor, ECF subfamily
MKEVLPQRPLASQREREEFVQTHMRRIYLQVFRMVGNPEDAQDLTQEVFIKALQRNEQIQDPHKAGHWLSRIATHTAIDHLRRKKRIQFTPTEDMTEQLATDDRESPERDAIRSQRRTVLEAGLRRLSDRERAALVLRDVEGLSAEEVADHLQCSKATVRSHIANARVKFRKFLENRGAI